MPVAELVKPAHMWVPDHVSTAGDEAANLCREVGLPLDPEQEMALDAILAEKRVTLPDGTKTLKWAGLEGVVVAPRRNIKTHLFKAVSITDLWLLDAPLVTWTAHLFPTAQEAFLDMQSLVEGSPLLSKRVKRITRGNGDEGIDLMSGARLQFRARTITGGRGLDGTRVILDEAFALRAAHLGALLPTMAANSLLGNPQILYGSSAGLVDSAVLRALRDRGRPGGDPSLVYLEWCAPELPCATPNCDHRYGNEGCVLDDRELWAMANLALGRRIDPEFMAAMRRSMPPEEFAREFLGWWDEPVEGGGTIPAHLWTRCARKQDAPVDPVAIAIDVAPGHSSGSIVVCGEIAYVVEHGPGVSWIPSKIGSLLADKQVSAVGIDPSSPAAALIPDLEKPVADGGAGLTIRGPKTPQGKLVLLSGPHMSSACEMLLSAVVEDKFRHRDQAVLNAAVEGAYRRQVGDSFKWSRRDSNVDISPLVAATEAWFLANTALPVDVASNVW